MNLGIIIARAGSRRLKNKNFKSFYGKPVINYTLDAAKKSKLFKKILVSTNCSKIKELISTNYSDIALHDRSNKLSDNKVKTITVIKDVLKNKVYKKYNFVCCLYPASPLLQSSIIKKCLNISKKKKAFCFPAFNKNTKNKTNYNVAYKIKKFYRKKIYLSSIKKNTAFDAGQFYWSSNANWISSNKIISKKSYIFLIKEMYAQDINNINDWIKAKKKFKMMKKKIS